MSDLTLKDKMELNERAERHGLPVLWPEAERFREWNRKVQADMLFAGLGARGMSEQEKEEFLYQQALGAQGSTSAYGGVAHLPHLPASFGFIDPSHRQPPPRASFLEWLFGGVLR